ncbi:MAG: RNA polymerase sigma factor [Gaiellaceae bacterium]
MLSRDPLTHAGPLIRRVYAYVSYRIGEGPDAEDVTSETFARAVRYRDGYDAARGDAVSWLIGIARRCIAAHLSEKVELLEHDHDRIAPGDLAEDAVRRLELARLLRVLSDSERELVALRFGADMTARQIAALLDLRVNTVEVALHRAIGRVRDELVRDQAEAEAPAAVRPAPRTFDA